MHVIVTGATGFIGRSLCAALAAARHRYTALTRDPGRAEGRLPRGARILAWDPNQGGDWQEAVAEADAVVNLAGEPIAGRRWSSEYKQRLRSSRLDATRAIVDALKVSERPDLVLINASAVGYYGDRGSQTVTEQTPPGQDFLAKLCVDWEAEARGAEGHGVRVVLPRMGIILGEGGGALERMVPVFRWFAGGPLGSGRQWVPWIHLDDVVRMMIWALENPAVKGPVNFTAPTPVTMREFAAALGRALRRPAFAPVPGFALRLMVGEMAEALLTSQRAIPEVAQRLGYQWKYPLLEPALRAILSK